MNVENVGRICLAVELDGVLNYVVIPQDRTRLILTMVGSCMDDGKLTVIPAPAGSYLSDLTVTNGRANKTSENQS